MTDIAHAAAGRHVVAPATHAAYLAHMLDWAHGDRLLALMQWGRTALAVMLAYAILLQPMLASLAMAQVGDHSSIERMLLVICSPFGDGQTDDTSQAVHVSPCCLVSQRAVLDHPEVQALLIDWLPSLEVLSTAVRYRALLSVQAPPQRQAAPPPAHAPPSKV